MQHFRFVNWWIGELMVSFFDVTNRLVEEPWRGIFSYFLLPNFLFCHNTILFLKKSLKHEVSSSNWSAQKEVRRRFHQRKQHSLHRCGYPWVSQNCLERLESRNMISLKPNYFKKQQKLVLTFPYLR